MVDDLWGLGRELAWQVSWTTEGPWYSGSPHRTGWDAGIGLRLGASRSTDVPALRFDLAHRFANDVDPAGWVITIGKGFGFGAQPEAQLSTHHPLVALLLRVMDQAYDQKSWHGTTLRGSLRGLTAEEALWRPGPNRHNIWELPPCRLLEVHRATPPGGGFGGLFERRPSNWPDIPQPADSSAWKRDVSFLESEHRKLREIVPG